MRNPKKKPGQKSAHAGAYKSLGAQTSAHTSVGAQTNAHKSALTSLGVHTSSPLGGGLR